MVIDLIMVIVMNIVVFDVYIMTIIGAIFCHVSMSKQFTHLNPSITSGNQKWKGAAPIFVKIEEFIIKIHDLFMVSVDISFVIRIVANMNIVEASVCVIKYFIVASDSFTLFMFLSKGMIDKRLISIPNHIPIHV